MLKMASLSSFISRLSKRERIVFFLAASVVGVMLLDHLIVIPILGKMTELNERIKSQHESIKKGFMILSHEYEIDHERNTYRALLSESKSEEKDITTFLSEVENLAKESGVYLVDIKPSGKEEETHSKQYSLDLNFEAQVDQLINFFYSLSSADQLIKIERYQVRPKAENSSILTCVVSVSKLLLMK